MGISRDSLHKRRLTGGKKPQYHKKRKYDMGRQMAMTKIGPKRVHSVRVRGGNTKFRAMRLDTGNFSWGSEVCTRKTRILEVMYNASNNELVRTKTLVKNAIVQIDATYAPRPPNRRQPHAAASATGHARTHRKQHRSRSPLAARDEARLSHTSADAAPLAHPLPLFFPFAGPSGSGTRRTMAPRWAGRRRRMVRRRRSR